jgi:uncharacterized membrane protein
MTLGIFRVGQQTQLNHFARADRNLAWIHIAFLCAVCLAPFSTSLLAEYIHYRVALLVYWFNILLLRADALLELELRHARGVALGRRSCRDSSCRRSPHRDRAIPLRRRRRALLERWCY